MSLMAPSADRFGPPAAVHQNQRTVFFHEADALLAEGKTSHQAMAMLSGRHDWVCW